MGNRETEGEGEWGLRGEQNTWWVGGCAGGAAKTHHARAYRTFAFSNSMLDRVVVGALGLEAGPAIALLHEKGKGKP